jgi:hypothetical protein
MFRACVQHARLLCLQKPISPNVDEARTGDEPSSLPLHFK